MVIGGFPIFIPTQERGNEKTEMIGLGRGNREPVLLPPDNCPLIT